MSSILKIQLKNISVKLKELYEKSCDALLCSMDAFKALDVEKASKVMDASDELDEIADNIEANIFETIARRQPVARDLRQLATYLQVTHHLYRIGRYAYKVAHIVKLAEGLEHFKELITLPLLANLAKQTIDIAMNAILNGDLSQIENLEKLEAQSDKETEEMFEEISEYLKTMTNITKMAMFYIIVGRYFERASDHAFSIAERAIYMITGEKRKLGLAYKKTEAIGPH